MTDSSQNGKRCVWLGVISCVLCACSPYPRAQPPVLDAPPVWRNQTSDNPAQSAQAIPANWWQWFDDPALEQLIAKAVAQSPDIRLSVSRIDEARAQTQLATAQLFPLIQGVGGVTRSHQPVTGRTARGGTFTQFEAGFDASWEIDLFGRLRETREATKAAARATLADSQGVTLSLIAEIVRQYVLVSLYRAQGDVALQNATAQSSVLKVAQARYNQGLDSRLELTRSQTLVQSTEAQIPLYQNLAQASLYQLDYLVGDKPGTNAALFATQKTVPLVKKEILLNVPLHVLQQRPDIRAATERVLAATHLTNANIATLYPSITVSGVLGLVSNTSNNLLQSRSQNWSLGGSVLAPLFDFGRIRANINTAKAQQEQAVITYEQTVLNALRDVETTAYAYQKAKERYDKLDQALQSSQKAVEIARRQYGEGILSQLDVLAAEQTSYATQQDTVQAAAELTQNYVALCKALGLGLDAVPNAAGRSLS